MLLEEERRLTHGPCRGTCGAPCSSESRMFNHASLLSPCFPALTYRNISSTSWSDYACHVDMHLYLKWNKSATAVCVVNLVQLYIEFVSNIQGSKTTDLYLLSMLRLAVASGHPATLFFLKKKTKTEKRRKDIFVIFKFSTEILVFAPILHWFSHAVAISKCQPDLKMTFLFLTFELKIFICTNQWLFLCFRRTSELSLAPSFVLMEAVYKFNANPGDRLLNCVEGCNTGRWGRECVWMSRTAISLLRIFNLSVAE